MNSQLKKGFIFTAIGTYSNFIVQIIIQTILSRLLTPHEYGIVAIMQVFIVFFALMIEAGMGPAIIQNKQLTNDDNRILFNYSAVIGIGIAIFFGFFGLILSWIYGNKIYILLTWIQSISVLFNGLNVVPTALLNKKKRFKAVNFSIVVGNLFGGIVGVTLALRGGGVYSLIFSAITSSFMNFMLNRFFTAIKFSASWDTRPLKTIWTFSKNQFSFNFINYFSRNSDNILIGKFMGADSLANYSKAYQLLMIPSTLLMGVIGPVLQPVLSDYQDDDYYVRKTSYSIVHLLGLIGMPLSIFLYFTSKPIIFIFFGNQWADAVFPFSMISLTIWSQLVISSFGGIIQARNKSELLFKIGVMNAGITVGAIVSGIVFGTINMVSICLMIAFFINFFISSLIIVKKVLNDKYFNFLNNFSSPLILGGLVFILLWTTSLIPVTNVFFNLTINSSVFVITVVLFILFSKERQIIIDIFQKDKE